jgi:aminoglycoside phosphotransferase (APT) family kinase protein
MEHGEASLSSETRRDLAASLLRMGLIEAGEEPCFTPLAGGVSSLILLTRTQRGPLCLKRALPKLRVAAEWHSPVERNLGEVEWMKQAALAAPQCVPRLLGQDAGSYTFAMEHLSPERYRNWKQDLLAGRADAELARAVGLRIAEIHGFTAGKPDCARMGNGDAIFSGLRLDPYYAVTAAAHPACAPQLRRLIEVTLQTKRALIHGDVSPKNILSGPDGPVFLDSESAWYGDPAFDLAFCLTHLLLKSVHRPDMASDYLAAFSALRKGYLANVTWEDPGPLEQRAAALLAGNLLARIDGKSPVEYLTAHRDREFVRDFAIRSLLETDREAGRGLEGMAERWRREVTRLAM